MKFKREMVQDGICFADVMRVMESAAPLRFQESYDNSGVQVGLPDAPVASVLVCLDITEAVVDEAIEKGCDTVVSHHPLIFKALKQICGATYQQRCVVRAIRAGLNLYSSHTALDNAEGGVNYAIAEKIGLSDIEWLSAGPGGESGSGIVGNLAEAEPAMCFLDRLRETFGVACLRHSAAEDRTVRRVAVCGGAGAFLLPDAVAAGADCFVCGEFRYHDYFENAGVLLAELGHYQSERFTVGLIADILRDSLPGVKVQCSGIDTNPINYLFER